MPVTPGVSCMPEWAAGTSHRLEISTVGATGVTIASLAIKSAPQCGDNAFDATFDRPLRNSSWSARRIRLRCTCGIEA